MNLSILETTMSWAAILIFVILTYWLILFIVGAQLHRWQLKRLRSSITSFSNISSGLHQISDSSTMMPNTMTGNSALYDPSGLLHSAARAWKQRDSEMFYAICDQFYYSISLSPSWLLLPKLATKFGLLFTVIGSLLAYMAIEDTSSPMDIMIGMKTALLTTVAGLVIEIICILFCTHIADESIRITEELFQQVAMKAGQREMENTLT